MATSDTLRGKGVFLRFLFAVLIVFATFNPWGASFYHWALEPLFEAGGGIGTLGPLKVLAGLVLIVGWVILTFHDVGHDSRLSNTEAAFKDLCDYLRRTADRVWTAPGNEVAASIVSWRRRAPHPPR